MRTGDAGGVSELLLGVLVGVQQRGGEIRATNFTERANEMGQPRQRLRAAGPVTSFAALA
ncbi:hypothetical protein B4903_22590 [Yersinia frederiksenii]|nr:hypothetical protein B4903_22590 [Yersinia frederiksenii]